MLSSSVTAVGLVPARTTILQVPALVPASAVSLTAPAPARRTRVGDFCDNDFPPSRQDSVAVIPGVSGKGPEMPVDAI